MLLRLNVLRGTVEQASHPSKEKFDNRTIVNGRVLSEEEKDAQTLQQEQEDRRKFQSIHPLTGK